MSQPPSHRGAPTRASEDLLRSARSDHAPSSADRERVRRALARRLSESADTLPDASASPTRGLLHPLAKTGIGLVLLAAGITTLMRSNDQPKSAAVKPPQTSELQLGEPTGTTQPPPRAAGAAVEPSVPALERAASSAKRAAPRSKAALRAGEAPAPKGVSAEAGERMERADAMTVAQPAVSRVSPAAHAATASVQAQVRESKPVAVSAEVERANTPAARAADAAIDGRAELAFMARIRTELLEAEHEHVLQLCDEHKRRWPHGMFAQEREGLRAIAICQTENSKAADHARAFFASYPQSPMAPRVRAACAPQLKASTPRKSR